LTDALSAALDAPTGVSQAAAFATVVGLRLAALRWGLQTPVPADVARKLQSRHREDDQDTPQAPDA
jgi:short subunit fatty acids transporter